MILEKLKDKINGKVAILGFGREGKSTLQFLRKLGAKDITILDKNEEIVTEDGLKYILGVDYLKDIKGFDLIIKSPGFSPYLNDFNSLEGKITTQTEIFINNYKGKIIGITGTKGKSTTSTVTNLALQNAGYKSILVGNIGKPVLDEIDIFSDNLYDYVIYEMSSYMLEGIRPQLYIGYINNLYDCHLDWHKGRENYHSAKLNILIHSKYKIANIETKDCILNSKNIRHPKTGNYILSILNSIIYFGEGSNIVYNDNYFFLNGEKIIEDKDILLQGPHNRTNICGIIAILSTISTDGEDLNSLISGLKSALKSFSGLPYRLENIGTYKQITFINDSMATTPDSSIAAINTFGNNIGTLFIGGQNSGFQFDKLFETIKLYKIPNIILLPEIGEIIFGDLNNYNYETVFEIDLGNGYKPKILKTKSLESGVKFAFENTEKQKVCLLSTGAPFIKIDGIWNSYIVKGDLFKKYVEKYGNQE